MSREAVSAVIERKLRVPSLPERVVDRPRLRTLLLDLIEHHRVVVLSATAGAGKTTAVVDAVGQLGRPICWLTLDRTDCSPGRLVTYLEAALADHLQELGGHISSALAAGVAHAEVAGLLAEASAPHPLVLVLDELERLERSEAAWAVVESLLRYAPESMRVLLLSRRDIPTDLCELSLTGDVAHVREADLSFTLYEAEAALAACGATGIDARVAVDGTGGWVTGVLFEAWRSVEHIHGTGGETDPLYGYLGAHVLGGLAEEDCRFLIATAVLDEVTVTRARALGQPDAAKCMLRLRAAHLPVAWDPERLAMTCHSRFREYLLECFERWDEADTYQLRLDYARLLVREGYDEEATEELLRIGELEEALMTAERAIGDVIARLDLPVAERWLAAFEPLGEVAVARLAIAELMLAIATEDFNRGVKIAERLRTAGERERLVQASERAGALMAWCYQSAGWLDRYVEVMAESAPGPTIDVAAYCGNLFLEEGSAPRPEATSGELDALIPLVDYSLGRLSGLVDMSGPSWSQAVANPWRIAALRASGQTQLALELYEQARESGTARPALMTVGPDVLIDANRHEEARALLARIRAGRLRQVSWVWVDTWLEELRIVLRVDRDLDAAFAILGRVESQARRTPFHAEWFDAWAGLALLLKGDDAAALLRLRAAVASMRRGGRFLHLPTACVYLAEAEWRMDSEAEAERAAQWALDAASQQGSNHLLLQALADFPAVVSRHLESVAEVDPRWHELGRALIAQRVPLAAHIGAVLSTTEFGSMEILVGGQEVRPSISKSYELLAYLAVRPEVLVDRSSLLDALFDGRDDRSSRAYLRQAIHKLRQALPDPEPMIVEDGGVRWRRGSMIDSESQRFQAQLQEAARLQGEARLGATEAALAIFDRGEYLPGVRSRWVEDRRQLLVSLADDARSEAAELAFSVGRYDVSSRLLREVLNDDPYRESAWRLSMRLAQALGDEDGVIRSYRDCSRALADIGVAPTPATRALLTNMRSW